MGAPRAPKRRPRRPDEGVLERPALADSALIDALRSGYDLEVGELTFLALGNDSVAWTYSATARDGSRWFVKVRRDPRPAGILVPAVPP